MPHAAGPGAAEAVSDGRVSCGVRSPGLDPHVTPTGCKPRNVSTYPSDVGHKARCIDRDATGVLLIRGFGVRVPGGAPFDHGPELVLHTRSGSFSVCGSVLGARWVLGSSRTDVAVNGLRGTGGRSIRQLDQCIRALIGWRAGRMAVIRRALDRCEESRDCSCTRPGR
jgi:hypothetical protein